MTSCIRLRKENNLARITLSKPPLNIFDTENLLCLKKILEDLSEEKDLKLIVIDSDQKVFSAGVDVQEHEESRFVEMLRAFHGIFEALLKLDVLTLSIVRSGCFGGGYELALFCDLTIASHSAYFSHPEIKLGCYPPLSLVYLPEITGNKKAIELIMTGERLYAEDALKLGLINHVFGEDEFEEKTEEFIEKILSNSASVMNVTLSAYKKINFPDIKQKLEIAEKIYTEKLIKLDDSKEGMMSFLEKRSPVWKNS